MPTYLFGDSASFPGGYDFLAELRRFVTTAAEVLRLQHEADELELHLGDRARHHLHVQEGLQSYFDSIYGYVAERSARSGITELLRPYQAELLQQVERVAAQARQAHAKGLNVDQVDVTGKIQERRVRSKELLSAFLLTDPIPTEEWALSLNLAGTAPHGQVVLSHPGDFSTAFVVDVGQDDFWSKARRISEVQNGIALQVGYKKAFLRSSVQPDVHVLDEFFISELELGPDSMDLQLRRKADASRTAYGVSLDFDDRGSARAKVTTHQERRGDSETFESPPDDVVTLLQLSRRFRALGAPLLRRKRRLLSAHMDDRDLFESGLVRVLFEQMIARMAPVAEQVALHSPNPIELSLKIEDEAGRRQEIYLRKKELLDAVDPLPAMTREMFRPLCFLAARKTPLPVPPLHRG